MVNTEVIQNLENEWKYLTVGAATWRWLRENRRMSESGIPLHTEVMAMDSAFLHGRNLYEFFRLIKDWRKDLETRSATVSEYGVDPSCLSSPWLTTWRHALNARLFHFRESRTNVYNKEAGDLQASDINREVGPMVEDLQTIWRAFVELVPAESDRSDLEATMERARHDLECGDLLGRLEDLQAQLA
ncbi:MAG: hypothetical protein GY788_20665 [bacterium]|nr:hypothetical protein [bacterium]